VIVFSRGWRRFQMSVKDMLAKKLKFSEMRRYRRIPLALPVKAVVNGIDEHQGQLVNISPGDLAIQSDADVVVGDAAVLYIDSLDVIEGRIIRKLPDGFALSFLLSRRRRTLLTEQLILKSNPDLVDGMKDRRQSPRHTVGDQRMVCRLPNGSSLFVRVIDMSVNGIAVGRVWHSRGPHGGNSHPPYTKRVRGCLRPPKKEQSN